MKKLILAIAAVTTLTAYGQGTIGFGNSSTTTVKVDGVNAGNTVKVQLFYAPNTATLGSLTGTVTGGAYEFVGLGTGWAGSATPSSILTAGIFAKTTKTTGSEVAGGATAYLQVRGWTGGYADWNAAYAAVLSGADVKVGWTVTPWLNGTGNPGGTPASPPVDMILGASGFNGLNLTALTPIPEPSTFALAGLAGAALLIFRRRQ